MDRQLHGRAKFSAFRHQISCIIQS